MKALMFLSKEKHTVIEVEGHPNEVICIGEDGAMLMRHVMLPDLRLCCYVPHGKSDKWARKRAEAFLADLEKGEMESLVKNDIDFNGGPADVLAAIAEAVNAGLEKMERVTNDSSTKAEAPTVAEIEKTLDEVNGFTDMVKYIDERIDETLWVDFTLPKGTSNEDMRFKLHYLKQFASKIASDVYWHTRTLILRDRALLVDTLVKDSHGAAVRAGWYNDPATGERVERNFGEMLALAHSEISEALEADRKDLMDDKLPQYHGTFVELVDLMIRDLDTLGMLQDRAESRGRDVPSIGQIYVDKRKFNDERADHKPENRAKANGKAY